MKSISLKLQRGKLYCHYIFFHTHKSWLKISLNFASNPFYVVNILVIALWLKIENDGFLLHRWEILNQSEFRWFFRVLKTREMSDEKCIKTFDNKVLPKGFRYWRYSIFLKLFLDKLKSNKVLFCFPFSFIKKKKLVCSWTFLSMEKPSQDHVKKWKCKTVTINNTKKWLKKICFGGGGGFSCV